VAERLAQNGAQLIILCSDPESAVSQELVDLLRTGTSNPRIFLERASLSSLSSIEKFVSEWRQKAKRTGAMGEVLGAEHLTALVFCPESAEAPEAFGARYAIYDGLLPTLEKSAATDEPRVVNVVSPFYAVGAGVLSPVTSEATAPPRSIPEVLSSLKGRRLQGVLDLLSILLFKEFQRRLDAAAAQSQTVSSLQQSDRRSRISTVSVSTGLTRTDVSRAICPNWTNPIRALLWLALAPFMWLVFRSEGEAARQVEWALFTPAKSARDGILVAGGFYRERKEIGYAGTFRPRLILVTSSG
jgi:NAD(P)-dependent dehydrogenase (short-subunit alcohol dehydrogenase family)